MSSDSDLEIMDDNFDDDDDDDQSMDGGGGFDTNESDEEGSVSDSGFSPISSEAKGKGRSTDFDSESGGNAGEVEYKVLSIEKLMQDQQEAVDYVKDMLGLKASESAVLLRFFAWKKEKLIESYMDAPEKALASAGIHEGGAQPRLKRVRGFTCAICYEDASAQETIALSCDHRFCKDCYCHYVTSKIIDEGESRRIQCMGSKCNTILDEKTIELLVDSTTLARYRTLLNRTYVDDDSHLRWCPYPNCEYAIECSVPSRSLDVVIPIVTCKCKETFCFGCGQEGDHRPCCCPVVRRWMKKCEDDSETSNWISANTKECTKCHSTIEKNGGCNHMTCKKCKWEFCWVCMGPWSEHGTSWYNCARYDEKTADKAAPDAQSKSRASLERYLHYYNRFANHEQSIKNEQAQYQAAEEQMETIQKVSSLSWIEVQFLSKAVETLGRCRTFLKWSYAMAFYLAKNNQTQMFEDNQNDLEQAVESLAELMESAIDEEKIAERRQQTTDKTVYVARRCQIMLEDTLKGYDEGRWIWSDPIVT